MTTVGLAPGGGTVARRDHALLFVPNGSSPVLRPFLDASDAAASRSALTSALIEAEFQAEPFALVTWDDGFQLLVFGALEVRTDMPELPMLSGAGSGTWVERRVAPVPEAVRVYAGEAATDGTDLTGGVVVAGGFDAVITAELVPTPSNPPPVSESPSSSATSSAVTEHRTPAASDESERGGADDPDTEVVPQVGGYTPPTDDVIERHADGLAALQAATGGDWMEDSLGLGGIPRGADRATPADDESKPPSPADDDTGSDSDDLDDEVTLGRDDVLPPGPITSAVGAPAAPPPPESPDASSSRGGDSPPGSSALPPPTGDPRQIGFEPREGGVDERSIVTARECPTGHLNAPHASRCRICGSDIHPDAPTVNVRQPVLGLVILPDGTAHPIDSTMVIGRKPDTDAAKVDAGARKIRIDTSSAVSRTHLVIQPEGWTVTVTDCGSRGGSVVINEPNADPTMLQPWVPQETPIGSEVYLGGPTKIVIAKPGGHPPAGGALDTLELPELPD